MIVIYTSPGCASCRKVKKWLKEHNLPFIEKNIFNTQLNELEIKHLLMRSENGTEDIISKRFKIIIENNIKKEIAIENVSQETEENPEREDDYFEINTNEELLERLINIRQEFANKLNLPVSMVLSKNTLKEISGRYPNTLEKLKDISGIGPKKIEAYGDKIVEEVDKYIIEKTINPIWKEKKRKKLIIDGETRSVPEIALDRMNMGEEIDVISEDMEISISTILGYITDYIKSTGDYSISIDVDRYFDKDNEKMILDAINKNEIDKIQAIKKSLPDYIKYEAIRAVILKNFILKN